MLFKSEEIKLSELPQMPDAMHLKTTGKSVLLQGNAADILKECVPYLDQDVHIHLRSYGHWSSHELLERLLEVTGAADVYFTTWAITENPVRSIAELINKGIIKSLHVLCDYKITERASGAVKYLESIATKLSYNKCHAKVTVILNDNWGVSVVSSANYTRNPRREAGVICTKRALAESDRDWIMEGMTDNKKSYEAE